MQALRESFSNGSLNANCANCDYYYSRPDFHVPEMRTLAKSTRRRLAGEIVRHHDPLSDLWVLE